MLLSRLAENMFWLGRYLERSEDLSRAIVVHGRMCLDLPVERSPGFAPILELCGYENEVAQAMGREEALSSLLHGAPPHTSVLDCVHRARENLRYARAILPREAWDALNPVYLSLMANQKERTLTESLRMLESVIAASQRVSAVLHGALTRDEAHSFMTLGQHIERADMLLRFVEVVAGSDEKVDAPFEDVRFMGLLESLGAFQMFRRSVHGPAEPLQALRFLLKNERFPRSLAFSLDRVRGALAPLPDATELLSNCEAIETFDLPLRANRPRRYAAHLLSRVGDLSVQIQSNYFH